MLYRILPHGGEKISVIGLGMGSIHESSEEEIEKNNPFKADACVKCGHCESRCPFHVKQEKRMEVIDSYFQGK